MNGQQLKNSVLQMAIQGKLVPQDPNDEPASVLLEIIRKEKEQLIKEGKIKKEKNSSRIYRASDNAPYTFLEERGKEVIDITEELPFEIPESWEWVRFENIIDLLSGQDMPPEKYNSSKEGIPYITGASNIENGRVLINRWTNTPKSIAHKNEILITCKGTIGKIAILKEKEVHIARQIMSVRSIPPINRDYVLYFLFSLVFNLQAAAKSIIPGIARDDVLFTLVPIPPLAEQQRIVDKLKELQPIIEEYYVKQEKSDKLQKNFPDQLKKSILQEAIQGKLVPQDPNDEPASALLERIRAEKEELIKQGKIKKDKNESIIFRRDNSYYEKQGDYEINIDGKIPFEIPDSWEWISSSPLGTIVVGATPSTSVKDYWDNGSIPWLPSGCCQDCVVTSDTTTLKLITKDGFESCSTKMMMSGTVMIALTGATAGKVGLLNFEACGNQSIVGITPNNGILPKFLFYQLMARRQEILSDCVGSAQPHISKDYITKMVFVLPPYNEQKRIVESIEGALEIIDTLMMN